MRCPDLYPPSPQMSPATSVISTRFGGLRHGPSPLSTRTLNSSISQRFNKRLSNGLSEDSDEEDPPPYPGVETAANTEHQSHCHHNHTSSLPNSTSDNSVNRQSHTSNNTSNSSSAIDNTGSQDSPTSDTLGSSPPTHPSTSPSLCLSELGSEGDSSNNEGDIHVDAHVTIHSNDRHNSDAHCNENPYSSHQPTTEGSDVIVSIATSDGNLVEEQSRTNNVENDDMRNRLDSQDSIVGTIV